MSSVVEMVRTLLWRVQLGKEGGIRLGDRIEERTVKGREKTNGDGRITLAKSVERNRKLQALRSLQMKGALSRLNRTIKDFGTELVITAKTNGNGHDT